MAQSFSSYSLVSPFLCFFLYRRLLSFVVSGLSFHIRQVWILEGDNNFNPIMLPMLTPPKDEVDPITIVKLVS